MAPRSGLHKPDLLDWGAFKWRHARLCAGCGHPEWHHTGLREPGCSHLGLCLCPAFEDEMRSTA